MVSLEFLFHFEFLSTASFQSFIVENGYLVPLYSLYASLNEKEFDLESLDTFRDSLLELCASGASSSRLNTKTNS